MKNIVFGESYMNCIKCPIKSCRKELVSCAAQSFKSEDILPEYHTKEEQKIVQMAAKLVDGGKAGTLSRIQEVVEFSKLMGYKKIGLAYCYGMESDASLVYNIFEKEGIKTAPISCTAGAMSQVSVNHESHLTGVSCNPLGQAEQMNIEGVDFAVTMGLCMGHDILFQNKIKCNFTNILVKDRPYKNDTIKGIKEYPLPK